MGLIGCPLMSAHRSARGSGPPSIGERAEDSDDSGLSGDVIRVPHLRRDRRCLVSPCRMRIVAAVHHDATEREMNEIARLEFGPRAAVSKRTNACIDERGIERLQTRVTDAATVEIASLPRVDQHVGSTGERTKALLSEIRELGKLIATERGELRQGKTSVVAVKADINVNDVVENLGRARDVQVDEIEPPRESGETDEDGVEEKSD